MNGLSFLKVAVAAVCIVGFTNPAVASGGRLHFTLARVGTPDSTLDVPIQRKNLPPQLVQTDLGQTFLMVPDYFLGEMQLNREVFDFALGGEPREYGVDLRFSKPRCRTEGFLGDSSAVYSLTLSATVFSKDRQPVFSGNFEKTANVVSSKGAKGALPADSLVRGCLAEFAVALANEFSVDYRVNVRPPKGVAKDDLSNLTVRIDGKVRSLDNVTRLIKGVHVVEVSAEGCETVKARVELESDQQTTVNLKLKK